MSYTAAMTVMVKSKNFVLLELQTQQIQYFLSERKLCHIFDLLLLEII